jgi:Na+/H+ antiporter NhaD/arsenite permease-like protein
MWRNYLFSRNGTSISALAICLGVGIGGSLPEVGNLAQYYILHNHSWDSSDSHFFNGLFITIGVLGIIICGLALYRRLLQYITSDVVKDK